MAQKLNFRRGDLVVIASVLLLALLVAAMFIPRGAQGAAVEIYRDGQLIHSLPLTEDRELTVSGQYQNTVSVKDGTVRITRSDCPGEDCVHSGSISRPGRSIVCLPNRVEIRISGSAQVDIIAG